MSLATTEVDSIELLLVEDREADIELARQGLAAIGAPINMHIARDGVEAIAFLRRESSYQNAPRPHLVLLDLNLPRMDGRELLAEIKGDPQLKLLPVVILTTSASDCDVTEAYAHHANAYMVKPVEFDRLVEVIRSLADYWLRAVKLPPRL
jgi:two-component system, chemotaxis family, response regulator Rcp1